MLDQTAALKRPAEVRTATDISAWQSGAFVLAIILVPTLVVLLTRSARQIAINIFVDDAFYYLQTARNYLAGMGSTFDQIHLTNGYHPLWFWVLLPVMALTDRLDAIPAIYLLQVGLFAIGSLLGLWALRRLGAALWAATLGFAVTAGIAVFQLKAFTAGLEGALLWLLLNATVLVATHVGLASRPRQLVAFGVLIGLVWLARLDTYPLCAAIGMGWTLLCHRQRQWRSWPRIAWVAMPVVLVAVLFVARNVFWFGTPLTVSALAKISADAHAGILHLGLLAALALPVVILLVFHRHLRPGEVLAWSLAAVGPLLVTALNVILVPGDTLRSWYLIPAIQAAWFAGAWGMSWLERRVPSFSLPRLAIVLGVLMVGNGWLTQRWTDDVRFVQWREFLEFSEEVDAKIPDRAILAGFDIGRVAYFLNRPVINLDGLANSADYVGVCSEGRLLNYLIAQKVAYVINYSFGGKALLDTRLRPCGPREDWAGHIRVAERAMVEVPRLGRKLVLDLVEIR